MKRIFAVLFFAFILVPDTQTQTFYMSDVMLNLRNYSSIFLNARGALDIRYNRAASDEDFERIAALGGSETNIDTALEITLLSNAAGVVNIRPVEASQMLGTPKQAALKLGAAVLMEIQILRFLGNTRAVGVHETELKFIIDRNYVTRADIETFYRNGIRGLVSDIVDEQLAVVSSENRNVNVNASELAKIKNAITDFMLAPSEATYRNLLLTYRSGTGYTPMVLGYSMEQINVEVMRALINNRILGAGR